MKKTLLFGASQAGINFINNSKDQRDYLAFIDNDPKKHGTTIKNLEIISPYNINKYNYDEIIITSLWELSIKKQLIEELKISPDKIIIPKDKNLLIISNLLPPFYSDITREFGRNFISMIGEKAVKNDLPLFINEGTLLGIIRDGDIIKWDCDIDFAALSKYAEDIEKFILNILPSLIKNIKFSVEKCVNNLNQTMSYIITFTSNNPDIIPFITTIEFLDIVDERAILLNTLGLWYCPKHHIEILYKYTWNDSTLFVPSDYEKLLEFIYGKDWKIPNKDFSFSDYQNMDVSNSTSNDFTNANFKFMRIL